ncbi:MAG TPA: SDR family oxidoreductase [Longimicrobiaceae bacterium]|nr:SDR family oxidoreductase [Longimicrobiaceae bacterium]
MDLGIKDRVAIVTGGSMGLGKAIARELARERARVVIAARSENRLRAAAEEIRRETGGHVLAVRADMTRPEDIEALVAQTVDRWGTVEIAVANAGGPPGTRFETTSAEEFEKALTLNLMSTIRLAQEVIPHMKARKWGRFIALTSVSVKQPIPGLILSNTARAGVVGFVKTIATELAPFGVLCNVVAPGYMRTGRVEELASERAENEGREMAEVMEEIGSRIPLGRMGEPEEFAALVAFLASTRASYITGTTIQADGGFVQGIV